MNLRILLRVCIVCFFIPSAFTVYYFEGNYFNPGDLFSYLKAKAENRTNELEQKLDRIIDILATIPKKCNRDVTGMVKPKSCADLRLAGVTCDGIYNIFPRGMSGSKTVKCDMTTDGGGWTILMKRSLIERCGQIGFDKNWTSYKNGFGRPRKEFWIGNEVMHAMSVQDDNILRISLSTYSGEQKILEFSSFLVGNESSEYELDVGEPTNSSKLTPDGPFLFDFNGEGVPFSTYDRKSERAKRCNNTELSRIYDHPGAPSGGWWFNYCEDFFLTGEYGKHYVPLEEGGGWLTYDTKWQVSMEEAEMMIRPRDFEIEVFGP